VLNAKLSATESPTLFATVQKYPRYQQSVCFCLNL
jgi:hypothetical protein